MRFKNKEGVLGLDTVKAVMISFLVLAVIGIAVILSLTSIQDGVASVVDLRTQSLSVTNETGGFLNLTGYTLDVVNSSNSAYTITSAFNATSDTIILAGNYTVSSAGVLTNATVTNYADVLVSYTYTNAFSLNRVGAITGNVSDGLVTFFSSTDTVFAILIVVVIILAISIIIWAVGRFGETSETAANL